MIGFKDQEELLNRVVEDLLHPQFPSCWNFVLPPGFGNIPFAEQLERRLEADGRRPLVALLAPDTVADPAAFVRSLHRRWIRAASALPEPAPDEPDNIALESLLSSAAAVGQPVVLILQRFHKILDNLQDWVLGLLRNQEQAYRLRTVTI